MIRTWMKSASSLVTPFGSGAAEIGRQNLISRPLQFLEALWQMRTLLQKVEEEPSSLFPLRPQLKLPELLEKPSLGPPRFFSKGTLESSPRRGQELPITFLLTEGDETTFARPVPGNSFILRSLCKGKGRLKRSQEGLYYLETDDRFIEMLLPYLKFKGLSKPPYYSLLGAPEGAHVPVILPRDTAFHYLKETQEEGREFSFELDGLYSVEPALWPEAEEVWFFKLKSPELEAFRKRLGLTRRPLGHSFHIAVAVKARPSFAKTPKIWPSMRINIAYLAA